MQARSKPLEKDHVVAAKNSRRLMALLLIYAIFILHLIFIGRGLSETQLVLHTASSDIEMWRCFATQSANFCFVGAFFLGEIITLAVSQELSNRMGIANFGIALIGFLLAIWSGMNLDLLVSGMG